ncbi:uncharacterized protein LOC133630292 isoform X3 [Entelurus aequoreus]|uniref:uncharacterized protein LOC133630292 isoform X3 n=1 Tax=Entelurus aequoreus TaxID=161455 RepID=UPI002B1D3F42|nr:uncharacterized protein LOC133630292 isoform X3 [Entelurus aequoreus]
MDSPSPSVSLEGPQALSSMATITSQTLPSDSTSSDFCTNLWGYHNNFLPGVQGGPFCYQNEGAQIVPIAMSTTQPGCGPRKSSPQTIRTQLDEEQGGCAGIPQTQEDLREGAGEASGAAGR